LKITDPIFLFGTQSLPLFFKDLVSKKLAFPRWNGLYFLAVWWCFLVASDLGAGKRPDPFSNQMFQVCPIPRRSPSNLVSRRKGMKHIKRLFLHVLPVSLECIDRIGTMFGDHFILEKYSKKLKKYNSN
jgi:hypothetical protein